ncbi:MAG: ribonuclease III domain-containing protein [candidate division WOR-3 bacterium]
MKILKELGEKDIYRATHHITAGNLEFYKLALLGDAVLNLYLTLKFYERGDIEEISLLVSEYKSNKALFFAVEDLGLKEILVADSASISEYTYASMLEAIIGVVYERFGLEKAFEFLDEEVFPVLERNYQKFKNYWEDVKRREGELDVRFEEYEGNFIALISLNGKVYMGRGRNKKEARNEAAKNLIMGNDLATFDIH